MGAAPEQPPCSRSVKALRTASNCIVSAATSLQACRRAKQRIAEEKKKQAEHQRTVANTPAPDTPTAMGTASLLRQALDYLGRGNHADACPVCRQPIPRTGSVAISMRG